MFLCDLHLIIKQNNNKIMPIVRNMLIKNEYCVIKVDDEFNFEILD